ncbi:tol-pal system-associated acyl-CoA thioesterase [Oceanicaulis alexandrii]|uniref:tol-pal system-associated acyl-CoA thioesterase n=1 Tax=Oceanicaulis alexandrii TaxID=153233 RepID=UPI0035CECB12
MNQPYSGHWSDAHIHRLPVRVYYEDTDFTGVVYYANYLKFLERGRTDALRCAGVSHAEILTLDPPLGFAVRKINLDYLKPARIDDALTIETRFKTVKGARLVISQRVMCAAEVLVTAEVEAACIDLEGRPRRLPRTMLDQLQRYVTG